MSNNEHTEPKKPEKLVIGEPKEKPLKPGQQILHD